MHHACTATRTPQADAPEIELSLHYLIHGCSSEEPISRLFSLLTTLGVHPGSFS